MTKRDENQEVINRLMTTKTKQKKKQLLRNNEYYDIQEIFDELYSKSLKGYKFKDLLSLITSEKNILLAYRNIKKNKGSKTKGTNNNTIIEIGETSPRLLVEYVRKRLQNFKPHSIRRKEIDKNDGTGKTRPLGIPTIEDRLIQQCIKQILEPICEAKFYNHSYGFRPNRSTHHAMARVAYLINKSNNYYVVDIDIKGFFDNVNHGKLLRQMWSLGIQDKKLICIISKLLKAEIQGIGTPLKGTPQGGILSPLLSNIVLNELDWWISGQWETFQTDHDYTMVRKIKGKEIIDRTNKYRAIRETNLKEMYIVRYADDFKIFCKDYKTAQKAFVATQNWLKERLNLEINPEKSKVINLNKNYSNFLGFKLKIQNKNNKKVVISHVSDKSTKKIIQKLKARIKQMQKTPNQLTVGNYNTCILGMQNYYKIATHVNIDFSKINFLVSRYLNRLKRVRSRTGFKSKIYTKLYGNYNFKKIFIDKMILFPIAGIKTWKPMNFSQEICNYTYEGRQIIHSNLTDTDYKVMQYLIKNPLQEQSAEYNDNRVSLYVAQKGRCSITGKKLTIGNMECHHKVPRFLGGTDEYKNLTFITYKIHKLIHAKDTKTIADYICELELYDDLDAVDKINKLRILVGNCVI